MTTAASQSAPALLTVRGLTKRFGPTPALCGADLVLQERQIHALVGTSGAGKSTLVAILSGLESCDGGEVVYRGYPVRLRSRRDAWRVGIGVAAQEATLAPDLSVRDNMAMPTWRRSGRHAPEELDKRAAAVLASLGWTGALSLDAKGWQLNATQRRYVEIARLLMARAKLYLFDEPFAGLASRDIDALVAVMGRLRLAGCGLLIATRRLEDVLPLADRITVLCEGRTTALDEPVAPGALPRLRDAMGMRAPPIVSTPSSRGTVLTVSGLAAEGGVRNVALALGAGEIQALSGAQDAELSAILEAVASIRRRTAGTVDLGGIPIAAAAPRAAVAAGLGVMTAAAPLPLPWGTGRQNLNLLRPAAVDGWTPQELWRSLDLPIASLDAPVADQPMAVRRKMAIACALHVGHRAVLLDQPARGLDAEARAAVRETLRAVAASGRAVLATWSEEDDLLALSHKVVVVRDGRTVATLPAALLDAEALRLLAVPAETVARSGVVLAELTRENGGAAFWALRRDNHVLCLNAAVLDPSADPGLAAARAYRFEDTRIAEALARCEPAFVCEPDGGRATVLVPIQTRRGQSLGMIGLTLAPAERPPPAAAVAFRIETLAATL